MRSKHAPLLVVAGLAASVNAAAAAPAIVWASAPLHALPTSRSAILARMPALAAVDVGPCRDWCPVQFGAITGFVPSRLLVATTGAPFQAAGGAAGGVFGSAYGAGCPASPGVASC